MVIVLIISLIIVTGLFLYVLWLKGQISTQAQEQAQDHFRAWRERELESLRKELLDVAQRQAINELDKWKINYEKSIRQDAIQKSQAVTTGKVTEQLVPYLPHFRYNPQDARFIGSPIDFIVFDGMTAGTVQQVVFIEVKTGSSSMSKIQKQVMDVVDGRKVKWEELRLDIKQVSHLNSNEPSSLPVRVENLDSAARPYNMAENYKVGEIMSHDTFGIGRVIDVKHNLVEVQFPPPQGVTKLKLSNFK